MNLLQCRRGGFHPWVRKILWKEVMATYSSIRAWKIPWTKEPGGPQSMRSQSQTQLNHWAHTHSMYKPLPLNTSLLKAYNIVVVYLLSRPTLGNPIECSPPSSFDHGISQARILEWVGISFFTKSSKIIILIIIMATKFIKYHKKNMRCSIRIQNFIEHFHLPVICQAIN